MGNTKINHKQLPKGLSSEYLDNGVSTEKLTLRNVNFDLEERTATAEVDVKTNFENQYDEGGDNDFHWSAITAYRAVSQLAVGYICSELCKPKREVGEIMQISSTMNTTAPITQTERVPIKITFPKYLKRSTRLLGELEFDVADKTFHGGIRFAVNL